MTAGVRFAWYDMWVGAYIDRRTLTVYVCLVPMVVVWVRFR